MKIKKLAVAVAVAASLGLAPMAIGMTPADAQVASTADAQHPAARLIPANTGETSCNSVLCIKVISMNGNVASIEAWVTADITGHFELQMPNHRVANSPNGPWYWDGYGYLFANWNGGYGHWCVTLWTHNSVFGWLSNGYTCVTA